MNTSYEKLSFYNSFFGGTIEGDNILSSDFYGNKTVVGVTLKKYEDTLNLLNLYYDKLVDLGVIEKEKTPEDIAKEQQEMMKQMMEKMQEMQATIDSMNNKQALTKGNRNDEYESNSKHCNEQDEFKPNATTSIEQFNRKGKGNAKFSQQSTRSIEESKL